MTVSPEPDYSSWTPAQIRANTLKRLAAKDSDALAKQLDFFRAAEYSECVQAQIDACLEADEPELIYKFNGALELYSTWCILHFESMLQHCPNITTAWERWQDSEKVRRIGKHLEALSLERKEQLLRGCGATALERRLEEYLRNNPELWLELSPVWLGPANSPVRRAAMDIGWKSSFLDYVFVYNEFDSKWIEAFPYAFAMGACFEFLRMQENEPEEFLRSEPSSGDGSPESVLFAPAHALPRDIALANLVMQHSGIPRHLQIQCMPHAEMQPLGSDELAHLSGVVQTYFSLGMIQELAMELANDVFPEQAPPPVLDIAELVCP